MGTVEVSVNPLTEDGQKQLVQRVAASSEFATSPTLRAFLLYVTDHAIAGRFEAIKEQQIGCHVFGRKAGYDPAEDNIVRVRARQLRQKLESYFRGEGHHEPVVISIPKGHYVPVFQPRFIQPERMPDLKTVESRSRFPGVPKFAPWLMAAAAVLITGAAVWSGRSLVTPRVPDSEDSLLARHVWASLLPGNQELTVITADAGFALWQDVTHQELNLGAYLSRKYLDDPSQKPEMREIAARRYTSPADLAVTLRLADIAKTLNSRVRVQFARSVDIHDVKSGRVVLLGSRRSNPWVELFEPSMNFVLTNQPGSAGPCLLNKSPKPGEPKYFSMPSSLEVHGAEEKSVNSYALAALVPNPSGHGMVLIVEGLSMEGTEAAGELITNLDRFGAFLHKIGVKKEDTVQPFEMLLKLTAVAGGYGQSELFAYRYGRNAK